jgi:serine/threonine protein phosphatase PrpC
VRVEVGFATDKGRVREGNEDAYLVEPPLYAVADGMGGHRGGEVASQLALQTLAEAFREGALPLTDQVQAANRAVFERSGTDRAVAGMGTTLTAALVQGELAHLIHVGDSRAYLLRAGTLRQLTEDHTLVNRMVKAGEITAEEAEVHPHRNVITRSLGTEADVDIDEQDVGLLEGDRLLLCSDGLTGMITEGQIQAILEANPVTQDAADRLVRAANGAGGVDNITVVVLDVAAGEPEGTAREVPSAVLRREPPPPSNTRRLWLRIGLIVAAVVVVLAAALVGLRAFLDTRWYVGTADAHVAIYQGVPADVFGFRLSHVAEEFTDISAVDAEALPSYANLEDGLNVENREEAEQVVEEIRLAIQKAQRNGGGG